MPPIVRPEYGPSLLGILRRAPRAAQAAAVTVLVLALVAAAALAVDRTTSDETAVVVREGPAAFNLAYGPTMERVREPGALLALERRRDGLFLDAFAVRPLRLPAYRGQAAGVLPLVAGRYEDRLRRRYRDFERVAEGRTRVNEALGYAITFRARLGERTLYGRHVLLVADELGGRDGVVLELEGTPAGGTPNPQGTGSVGALKLPLRSFRFGVDRSGGV